MKKYLWMLSVFFLIISVITISKTYGLFETNAIANPEIKVAKWQINVDNKDITESKEITLSNFIRIQFNIKIFWNFRRYESKTK